MKNHRVVERTYANGLKMYIVQVRIIILLPFWDDWLEYFDKDKAIAEAANMAEDRKAYSCSSYKDKKVW